MINTAPRSHSYIVGDLVQQHGWQYGRGAEIGVFRAQTLFHLLDRFPNLSMIGVDKWQNLEKGSYGRFDMPPIGREVRELALRYGARCRILYMDSVLAAPEVEDGSLDFVFIDGFHSFEQCSEDIIAWKPKVKRGGYVTGHDWQMKTVAEACDKLLPGWEKHAEHVWSWPNT